MSVSTLAMRPLTPERWDDFAVLCRQMGPNRSCWCMWWREDPAKRGPRTRRQQAQALARRGPPPGLIAYRDGVPVGWVAVAPRSQYHRLNGGRDTSPVDDRRGVWAIPCFFVTDGCRGEGLTAALLEAAIAFAAEHGASTVEGVPVDPLTRSRTASASYTGVLSTFAGAGFSEVARRTPKGRVVMRRTLGG